jgi:hypothetical protein
MFERGITSPAGGLDRIGDPLVFARRRFSIGPAAVSGKPPCIARGRLSSPTAGCATAYSSQTIHSIDFNS